MSKSRKSLVSPRKRAYSTQSGRCFYCGAPMWQDNPKQFASDHELTLKQTMLLRCTGEHLTAHSEGGQVSQSNIVAACWYFNSRRHKATKARTPNDYRGHVRRRIAKGRWHQISVPMISPAEYSMVKSVS